MIITLSFDSELGYNLDTKIDICGGSYDVLSVVEHVGKESFHMMPAVVLTERDHVYIMGEVNEITGNSHVSHVQGSLNV
jgi:hypothetical protein